MACFRYSGFLDSISTQHCKNSCYDNSSSESLHACFCLDLVGSSSVKVSIDESVNTKISKCSQV